MEYEDEQKSDQEADEPTDPVSSPIAESKCIFVASIDEYVPFHIYSSERGESRTIPALDVNGRKPVDVDIAVVALSKNGNKVAAVYIIEK